MKKLAVLGGVLVAAFVLVLIFAGGDDASVEILAAENADRADIKAFLQETGIVKPQVGAQISIGTRATGVIEELHVTVGDEVEKGQLIARIDSRQVRQNIEQVRQSIRNVVAKIEQEKDLYPIELTMAEEDVAIAEARAENALAVYAREKELFEKGFSDKETLDTVQENAEVAERSLSKERLGLTRLKKDHDYTLRILQSELGQLKAQLGELNVQLSYTEITAPISGVVTQVAAEEGETIVAGLQVANLITVFKPELLEMWIYVDETDVGKIAPGMPVRFFVDTYGRTPFEGTITKIHLEPEVKESIVYYLAIVPIDPESARKLKPEMTTHVRIITDTKENVLSVPNGALKWDGDRQVVYRVLNKDRGAYEKIPVVTGIRGETRTEILEGLAEGDSVATKIIIPNAGGEGNGGGRR